MTVSTADPAAVALAAPDVPKRAHGTRARYVWGPDHNDEPGSGCRCPDCASANRCAEAHRERMILCGRWRPYVDAGPARQHVRALSESGIGWRRAAVLAGVSAGSVSQLLFGGPGDRPPARQIRPETERKILAVRAAAESLGGGALVDATGTQRRLQALVAAGYSQAILAARLGMLRSNFTGTMIRARLTAATARAARELYDELWDVPPDEGTHRARISVSRARNHARAHGWPLPMAWDDDTIDDPAARPAADWRRSGRLSPAELAEDAAELVAWEGSKEFAAGRLGVKRSTLDIALLRAGRAS